MVVLPGLGRGCVGVIQNLGQTIYPIPVTDVVHCEPVKTEYEEIRRIHTDKVIECPDIDFYSAIDYEVSKLDSKTLEHNVATIYGKTVDYSRLIEKVYADEARILWIWDLEQPAQSGSVKLWINGLTFRSVLTVRVLTTEK